jgi:hypothetical protein
MEGGSLNHRPNKGQKFVPKRPEIHAFRLEFTAVRR